MNRQQGNVGNLMITGICTLAITVLMLSYLGHAELLSQKAQVDQLARKYILKMETVGYLTQEDRVALNCELEEAGASELDFYGSTVNRVTYGMPITLQIQGKLGGKYDFAEKRVSTAKN